jgi:hypothetical protein
VSVRSARYNLLSLRNPKGLTFIPEERDAWAFLDAAGITSSRQQRAVIELVRGLKHAQLWSKMKAIYPFVGGTATTHKFNLKDPRDADAAYRLSFNGGMTHNSNGITGNGTNAYANTFRFAGDDTSTDWHRSLYSRTSTNTVPQVELGTTDSPSGIFRSDAIGTRQPDGNAYLASGAAPPNEWISFGNSNGSGHYINSRTASNSAKAYKNGSVSQTSTATGLALPGFSIFIMARNATGSLQFPSTRNLAFATIGEGLTDTNATNLYNIVQRFQTSLGRQV